MRRSNQVGTKGKKLTLDQAARLLTELAMEHLEQYPEAERAARIKAFGKTVDRHARMRAKSSKRLLASRVRRQTPTRAVPR